jgi:uncharacterized protein
MDIQQTLIQEFSLKPFQVENVIALIDDGNTIPFIARYRKEKTGELDDQVLRELSERLSYLRGMEKRREEIRGTISEQGNLTDEIALELDNAKTLTELEDIYRPFKPKRRTRATIAREKGLEGLATLIFAQELKSGTIEELANEYINPEKGVNNTDEAIAGAMDIIAEEISDDASIRKGLKQLIFKLGSIVARAAKKEDSVYQMYYEYTEPFNRIVGHRILAIDRGEREGFLKISIDLERDLAIKLILDKVIKGKSITTKIVIDAACDAYDRLTFPSVEREMRNDLSDRAGEAAIRVFALNLKPLLMQPPVKDKVTLGLDPAYRTGCKIAVVDELGKVLDTTVIYPTPPQSKVEEAKAKIKALISKYKVETISIGNGTASKESEMFVSDLIREIGGGVAYMVVNEAGASVYSASKLAAQEFPEFDVSIRSAVSIARRLQDPLAELVKIDPKSIGVGQYQHDMKEARLDEALGGVVESCVNTVGVDLNTASFSLLSYVAGIGNSVAKNVVAYREENGAFKSRNELLKVAKLGQKAYVQCAGFLRITDSKNVLDNTGVHPESYTAAKSLLELLGYSLKDVKDGKIGDIKDKATQFGLSKLSEELNVGEPTLRDIMNELLKPGRDPRDELPKPLLRTDVLDLKDLYEGMELDGTIRNVIDFGAFVDIGVHQDGLVHISQLCDKYIKHPSEIVKVGDIVKVWVISVDPAKKRISLTMKKPQTAK